MLFQHETGVIFELTTDDPPVVIKEAGEAGEVREDFLRCAM